VDLRRVRRGLRRRHEAEVVVPVRLLRGTTGVDDVDLRRHLVGRPQPGLADEREGVVGVVGRERLGVAQRELVERAPDPVVGTRLREVVAGGGAGRVLLGDHRLERRGGAVDDRDVRERAGEDDDAGPVGERVHDLGLQLAAALRVGGLLAERTAVHRHVLPDVVGERVVAGAGGPLDERAEGVEVGVVGGEPDPRTGALAEGRHGDHILGRRGS
jgi:hypothetical protein